MQRSHWFNKFRRANEFALSWRYPGTMYEGKLTLTRNNDAITLCFAAPCNHEIDTLSKYRIAEHMDWREYFLDNTTDVENMKFFLDEVHKIHPFIEYLDEVYEFAGVIPPNLDHLNSELKELNDEMTVLKAKSDALQKELTRLKKRKKCVCHKLMTLCLPRKTQQRRIVKTLKITEEVINLGILKL